MRYTSTIIPFSVGFDKVVRIPESWTAFAFNGFLYVRAEDLRFVIMAKVTDENKSDLREKRA